MDNPSPADVYRQESHQRNPEMYKVCLRLEEKFADRGLFFTRPFAGAVPVQAFGHVDGKRFYFRFRGNHASLKVGPVDEALDELRAFRINQDKDARRVDKLASGAPEGDFEWLDSQDEEPQSGDDLDYMPNRTTHVAQQPGYDPSDHYNGSLDAEECFRYFSEMMENMEELPEAEQLDETTRIWLFEGRAAMDAHWERERAKDAAELAAARATKAPTSTP